MGIVYLLHLWVIASERVWECCYVVCVCLVLWLFAARIFLPFLAHLVECWWLIN